MATKGRIINLDDRQLELLERVREGISAAISADLDLPLRDLFMMVGLVIGEFTGTVDPGFRDQLLQLMISNVMLVDGKMRTVGIDNPMAMPSSISIN